MEGGEPIGSPGISGLPDKGPGPGDRGLGGGPDGDPRRDGGASGLAGEGGQSSVEPLPLLFWFLAVPFRRVVVRSLGSLGVKSSQTPPGGLPHSG